VQRVFVTGARGFAGRWVAERLAQDSVEMLAFEGDVRDPEALASELRAARPDAVLHLAALSSVAEAWRRRREVWDVNATGTLNLLQAVAEAAPEARVVLVSSSEVYGIVPEERQPIREDAPLAPRSPYGAAKAAAEMAAAASGLDVAVVRPFPHIGPGQSEQFAVASFVAQIGRIERGDAPPVLQVGNLDARRDLTDVRCVADAYVLLLQRPGLAGPFNVCSGRAVRIGDVLERLLAYASRPIEVEVAPERLRPVDVPLLLGDASRLHEATGWQPRRPLDDTLQDLLASVRAPRSVI
jgi:GDP-4-dehydro-6-deoxy-D-mannose reductase